MARIISICNQKGGVGKTTTAINVCAYIASAQKRVLLVDFDPQGNASLGIGLRPRDIEKSVYHALLGYADYATIVQETAIPNFHIIPANPDLAGALVELMELSDREFMLKKFLTRVRHHYHYIFIDLPPSLSLLTVNGLVASDEVLIPIQAEYYSLEGLGQLLETIELIHKNLGAHVRVLGAVLTMYNRHETLSREVEKEIRRHFPHKVFESMIPRSVSLAEAPSFHKPVILYDPHTSGAQAYEALAKEILHSEPASLHSHTGGGTLT